MAGERRTSRKSQPFEIRVLYTDEKQNLSGLPEWDPPEPLDDEMFILLISLALLVITLFLPALILLLLGGYKRSHRQRTFEKHPTGDPTQMDHIFDRDGCYRQSRFEGMLSEDAADDVEIPPKSEDGSSGENTKQQGKKAGAPKTRNAATQTDPLFNYSADIIAQQAEFDPIFDHHQAALAKHSDDRMNILKNTVEQQKRTPKRKYSLRRTHRDTLRQRRRAASKSSENDNKHDAHWFRKMASTPLAQTQAVSPVPLHQIKSEDRKRTPDNKNEAKQKKRVETAESLTPKPSKEKSVAKQTSKEPSGAKEASKEIAGAKQTQDDCTTGNDFLTASDTGNEQTKK